MLLIFSMLSSLTINFSKSKIFSVGLEQEVIHQVASKVSCLVGNLLVWHLGLPIEGRIIDGKEWDHIVDMFRSQLNLEMESSSSFAGRENGFDQVYRQNQTYTLNVSWRMSGETAIPIQLLLRHSSIAWTLHSYGIIKINANGFCLNDCGRGEVGEFSTTMIDGF